MRFMQPLDATQSGDLRREDVRDQRSRCEFWEWTEVACLSSDNEVLRLAPAPFSCALMRASNGSQMFLLAGGTTSSVIVKGTTVSGSGGGSGIDQS